jgi:hypothetical protein
MLRKYKNRQGGMFCIKKIIQMSSIFLTQGKIRKIILGPREEKDGNPSRGIPHPSSGVPCPSRGIYRKSVAEWSHTAAVGLHFEAAE